MRKIEKEMLAAVCEHRNWNCGNTIVTCENNVVCVYLHGNLIYEDDMDERRESFTLAGWNTPTTRSRLRALGADICQKNGKIYASKGSRKHEIEIDKNSWYNF